MSYLARLKAMESGTLPSEPPSKPSKAPFEPFEGSPALDETESGAAPETIAPLAGAVADHPRIPLAWEIGFVRLEARPIPPGLDRATWLATLAAAGKFLDRWGAKAAGLGWTAAELFGLDHDAPLNRRDRRGAAFFLVGAEMQDVTAEEITLRVGDSVQRLRHRAGFGEPAWNDS